MREEFEKQMEKFQQSEIHRHIPNKRAPTTVTYVTAFDEAGRRLYISPQIEGMSGFSVDEWLADPELLFKQLHPDDRESVIEEVFQSQETGKPFYAEYRFLSRDGRVVWIRDEGFVLRDDSGRPRFLQGVMLDISEQKRREERLEKSESKFRTIFEKVASGIALVDTVGHLMESNPALQEMLGYSAEELRNRVFNELAHPDDAEIDEELKKELIEGKRDHYQTEKRYIRKDGEVIWGCLNVSLARDVENESEFMIYMVEDITERKRLEDQFFQSQKMETIGRLAGGIAHDFNNLLTVIKGYTQLSLNLIKEDDPCRENIDEILKASDRASELTQQLLAVSRRQVLNMQVLELNGLIRGLEKMVGRVIGEDIEMITMLTESIGKVKSDPGQIEQVILNLAVNARDAMPKGGKLTIETANVDLDENYTRSHIGVTPGAYVMLSVSDTGVGMPPEVKEHLFEPFFTTKEKGKGTGLGLSTIYGIIKQSGGNIWVYSEPGQGTTIKIYLPRVEEEAEGLPLKNETKPLPKGDETVLLVEDESAVRGFAARVLREQGYTVFEATNGIEAVNIAREKKDEKIHLLLTDMVMPQMGGKELVRWIKTLHPKIKVLSISGYTEHAVSQHTVIRPGTPFLQKPFSPAALAKKVREVLDQ
jgi:two-component system cell cycle sensor histidine kinase/response regulator CckA